MNPGRELAHGESVVRNPGAGFAVSATIAEGLRDWRNGEGIDKLLEGKRIKSGAFGARRQPRCCSKKKCTPGKGKPIGRQIRIQG